MESLKRFWNKWMNDELDIQHKLLNLILLAAFIGGIAALFISAMFGNDIFGTIQIAALIVMVGLSLLVSNVLKKPQAAAILIII